MRKKQTTTARRRLLPYSLLARYIEDLISLCSVPSLTGIQLEQLRDGTFGCGRGPSSTEEKLIAMCDRWPGMPQLTFSEIRLLAAYSGGGDIVPILSPGGYVVDVEMTGSSHEHVARALSMPSPEAAAAAYRSVVARLLDGSDFFCHGC